ncbi:thermonuclease family protein [Rubellimicrobium roseum]|uniref:Thermonuclease family protein n=1 Tax=Rubellimicrobium roseum TaxID=687525 RepID=A0A5C4N9Y3_9RHOB|nr:thermonuclease family protein [Rubellimicrobium roseum]TNC71654.1 thermonuclease family protein [Rubellimicrobium roseum]
MTRFAFLALGALLIGVAILELRSGDLDGVASAGDGALRGTVRMIDADTLDLGDARVRLHGVDAPERDQICLDESGVPWDCGAWATTEAQARWDGQAAVCEVRDTDRYGRSVARCVVEGVDLGAVLVAEGMAVAYRDYSLDYVPQEDLARAGQMGLWRGEFQRPADYRRDPDSRITDIEVLSARTGCEIKGNISGSGRIYHMPGGTSYDRTEIDETEGERWFCSEDEALAAGWRRAAR